MNIWGRRWCNFLFFSLASLFLGSIPMLKKHTYLPQGPVFSIPPIFLWVSLIIAICTLSFSHCLASSCRLPRVLMHLTLDVTVLVLWCIHISFPLELSSPFKSFSQKSLSHFSPSALVLMCSFHLFLYSSLWLVMSTSFWLPYSLANLRDPTSSPVHPSPPACSWLRPRISWRLCNLFSC